MDACKLICYNMRGQNFVNAVAYLSVQIVEIFLNAKIENKNKCRLSEVRTEWVRNIGRGHGPWKSYRHDGGVVWGIGGSGGGGSGGDPDRPYNICNGVEIQDISRYFSSADWDALQGGGRECVIRQRGRVKAGGRRVNDGIWRGHGNGGGQHISETDTDRSDYGCGGCGSGGRGAHNGARFGGKGYWLLRHVVFSMCSIFKWKSQQKIIVIIYPYNNIISRKVRQVNKRKVVAAHIRHYTILGTQSRADSYYSFCPFLSPFFAYNSPIYSVSPLYRNSDNARIIFTGSILKASKVAYSPKGIVYV